MSNPEISARKASMECLRALETTRTRDQAIAVAHVQALIYIGDVLAIAAGVGDAEEGSQP